MKLHAMKPPALLRLFAAALASGLACANLHAAPFDLEKTTAAAAQGDADKKFRCKRRYSSLNSF